MAGRFRRLIRFADSSGTAHYGELPPDHPWDAEIVGITVPCYDGGLPWDNSFHLNKDRTATVSNVLCPVAEYTFMYFIGLNYKHHAQEAGFPLPGYPIGFVKSPGQFAWLSEDQLFTLIGALAGPYEDIPIPPAAKALDYEAELAFIIGRDCKNPGPDENLLDYVLGYTVANDVSSRFWQAPENGAQHSYAKSFDKFAPLGPVLVSSREIPDPSKLNMRTRVNGEQRQETCTDDMIFDVSALIRHYSNGTTLRKATIFLTGTPSGVGAFQKPTPKFLQDADVVEIEIEGIGVIRNKMVFET